MTIQRDAAWVRSATDEERVRALTAGELAHYMGGQTADERAQDAVIAGTPDRLYAQAHGFSSYAQMQSAVNAYGTSLPAAIRRDMSPERLEKLSWLESASPEEAYTAEQSGELDQLLGRGKHEGATTSDGLNRALSDAVLRTDVAAVESSALYQESGGQQ